MREKIILSRWSFKRVISAFYLWLCSIVDYAPPCLGEKRQFESGQSRQYCRMRVMVAHQNLTLAVKVRFLLRLPNGSLAQW